MLVESDNHRGFRRGLWPPHNHVQEPFILRRPASLVQPRLQLLHRQMLLTHFPPSSSACVIFANFVVKRRSGAVPPLLPARSPSDPCPKAVQSTYQASRRSSTSCRRTCRALFVHDRTT